MNKAYGIAALVGSVGYTVVNGNVALAQSPDHPPRFGPNMEFTYTVGTNDDYRNDILRGDSERSDIFRRKTPLTGENWGKIVPFNGKFILWGILNNTVFVYDTTDILNRKILTLKKDGVEVRIEDYAKGESMSDIAAIDKEIILMSGSNFFETQQDMITETLKGKVHRIYSDFTKELNVRDVELMVQSEQKLHDSLDKFLKTEK